MREINISILHCSASSFGDAETIDRWHKERGWDGIGYHFVVLNGSRKKGEFNSEDDGLVEEGRPIEKVGAHCRGHNTGSIGICLIGEDVFTDSQLVALVGLIKKLTKDYHVNFYVKIYGHYEFDDHKTCPNIDMNDFRKYLEDQIK